MLILEVWIGKQACKLDMLILEVWIGKQACELDMSILEVVNFYIPHNRRTPLQAEEALGPIYIPRGSCRVDPLLED
jgi:hypothetical protein